MTTTIATRLLIKSLPGMEDFREEAVAASNAKKSVTRCKLDNSDMGSCKCDRTKNDLRNSNGRFIFKESKAGNHQTRSKNKQNKLDEAKERARPPFRMGRYVPSDGYLYSSWNRGRVVGDGLGNECEPRSLQNSGTVSRCKRSDKELKVLSASFNGSETKRALSRQRERYRSADCSRQSSESTLKFDRDWFNKFDGLEDLRSSRKEVTTVNTADNRGNFQTEYAVKNSYGSEGNTGITGGKFHVKNTSNSDGNLYEKAKTSSRTRSMSKSSSIGINEECKVTENKEKYYKKSREVISGKNIKGFDTNKNQSSVKKFEEGKLGNSQVKENRNCIDNKCDDSLTCECKEEKITASDACDNYFRGSGSTSKKNQIVKGKDKGKGVGSDVHSSNPVKDRIHVCLNSGAKCAQTVKQSSCEGDVQSKKSVSIVQNIPLRENKGSQDERNRCCGSAKKPEVSRTSKKNKLDENIKKERSDDAKWSERTKSPKKNKLSGRIKNNCFGDAKKEVQGNRTVEKEKLGVGVKNVCGKTTKKFQGSKKSSAETNRKLAFDRRERYSKQLREKNMRNFELRKKLPIIGEMNDFRLQQDFSSPVVVKIKQVKSRRLLKRNAPYVKREQKPHFSKDQKDTETCALFTVIIVSSIVGGFNPGNSTQYGRDSWNYIRPYKALLSCLIPGIHSKNRIPLVKTVLVGSACSTLKRLAISSAKKLKWSIFDGMVKYFHLMNLWCDPQLPKYELFQDLEGCSFGSCVASEVNRVDHEYALV